MQDFRLLLQNEYTYGELGSIISPAIKRARKEGLIPDTALINKFKQPSVIYCYYINPEKEINLEYCKQNNILIQRFLSSGGTGVSDTGQIVFSMYFDSSAYPIPSTAQGILRVFLTAIAESISNEIGIDCVFRPMNDITIGSKKFTLCTCHLDGTIVQFRLGIQVKRFSLDVDKILCPPPEKFVDKEGKSVGEVITSIEEVCGESIPFSRVEGLIQDCLSRVLGIEFSTGNITRHEIDYIESARKSYDTPLFKFARTERTKFGVIPPGIHRSEYRTKIPRGPMISIVSLTKGKRVENILINGSFQASPLESIEHLEKLLLGVEVQEEAILEKVEQVFQMPHTEFPGLTADQLTQIIMKSCAAA